MRQVGYLIAYLALVCTWAGSESAGDIIYVSTCGDDAWSGAEPNCVGPDGSKATIQAAINASGGGDTVMVLPGTYTGAGNRDIDFGGKAITVQGSDPNDPEIVAATIINCQAGGRGFIFDSSETSSSVLSGLTITNGYADDGGGIYCYHSNPTITKCQLISNTAASYGGGICCEGGETIISHCILADNSSELFGGGMSSIGTSCRPEVSYCTIVDNYANVGVGGIDDRAILASELVANHCIVWGNTEPQINGSNSVTYCDVQGGYAGTGNIDADPLFMDEEGGDYHLSPESPCINAGDPGYSVGAGQTDIDGDERVVNGRVDIGADEFYSSEVLIGSSASVMFFQAEEGGSNPGAQILSIFNSGSGTFNWTLSETCDWLQATPTSGTCVNGDDPCEVTVSVEVSGLEVGLHEGEIILTSAEAENSPRTIRVFLSYGIELRHVPNEYGTIQAAINASSDDDVVMVAKGTYTGDGNRDLDFGGRAIMVRSTDPSDPDVVAATVIDGECEVIDCRYDLCYLHRGFYFHNGEGPDAEVSGFTITNFCAPDVNYEIDPMAAGGGILCEYASPTISFCVIDSNCAHRSGGIGGGGIHCEGGNPTIIGCTVSRNDGYFGGGGIDCDSATITQSTITDNNATWSAGGIECESGTTIINCVISDNRGGDAGGIYGSPEINNCAITDNRADYSGAGIYGSPEINNCFIANNSVYVGYGGGVYGTDTCLHIINSIIIGNSAQSGDNGFGNWIDGKGGGVYCPGGTITNSIIANNYAEEEGGGIHGNPTISNSTFSDNSASYGGGVFGHPVITNSILWGNSPEGIYASGGTPLVTYSDVEGGYSGTGNIDIAPLFYREANDGGDGWIDAPNTPNIDESANNDYGDFHLKSQAGRWDPNSESWVNDTVTSPCIDAGNPGTPLGDEPADENNVRINMGAYGGTAEASKTPTGWGVLADLTNDGIVNLADYNEQAADWLENAPQQPGDLNRDGKIDVIDLALLVEDWLEVRQLVAEIDWEIDDECTNSIWFGSGEDISAAHQTEQQEVRFSVRAVGSYIFFEDMMVANCCPGRLWLEMSVEDNLITINEHQQMEGCWCICEFRTTAMLGPFEPGDYLVEVYDVWGEFLGAVPVTIGDE